MQARKENKVYTIDEQQAADYIARGYDIYDGVKLIKHAANKTVPIAVYEQALAEVEKLEAEVAALKKAAKKAKKEE